MNTTITIKIGHTFNYKIKYSYNKVLKYFTMSWLWFYVDIDWYGEEG